MPVLFLLSGPKMGFLPRRATRCPDKREIWHGERTARSGPQCQISRLSWFAPRAKFHLSGHKCGNTAPKLSKFWILDINMCLRGNLFAVFLRNSQHLYVSKRLSCKHFSTVGAFSLKFSIVPSGETTDQIKKKLRGCKNGIDLLYHHAKYGGDCGSRASCRRKSVMFFVCLSRTKIIFFDTTWKLYLN